MLKTSASGARRIVVSALVALAVCVAVPGNALAQSGQDAAQKLVDEARVLMSAAIAGAGFTDAEYMEIARTAQADPTLRARLEALVGSP